MDAERSYQGSRGSWATIRKTERSRRGGDPTLDFLRPIGSNQFQSRCDQVKSLVLEKKRGTATMIAKETGLRPEQVYGCLETLVIQNLVTTESKATRTGVEVHWKLVANSTRRTSTR